MFVYIKTLILAWQFRVWRQAEN